MNKKELYNSIMSTVAKEVKKSLNETKVPEVSSKLKSIMDDKPSLEWCVANAINKQLHGEPAPMDNIAHGEINIGEVVKYLRQMFSKDN